MSAYKKIYVTSLKFLFFYFSPEFSAHFYSIYGPFSGALRVINMGVVIIQRRSQKPWISGSIARRVVGGAGDVSVELLLLTYTPTPHFASSSQGAICKYNGVCSHADGRVQALLNVYFISGIGFLSQGQTWSFRNLTFSYLSVYVTPNAGVSNEYWFTYDNRKISFPILFPGTA
jgi:hypothetical protein